MRAFRTILAVFLTAAWLPLTAHCAIESATGWEALRCGAAEEEGGCNGSPCDTGSCCGWESGRYELPAKQPQIIAPVCVVLSQFAAPVAEEPAEAALAAVLVDAPRKRPKPWQFSLRAALPVRAPSIAS